MTGERHATFVQRPPDELVQRVVAAHVLSHRDQLAARREQPGSVDPAGEGERRLGRAGGRASRPARRATRSAPSPTPCRSPRSTRATSSRRCRNCCCCRTGDRRRARRATISRTFKTFPRSASEVSAGRSMEMMSSASPMTPSPKRNPATNSSSCPGVRISTVTGLPPIRSSSGASTATASARGVPVPPVGSVRRRTAALGASASEVS